MAEAQKPNQRFAGIAWGLLLILWGLTILFDFIPLGVGLIGTGLIFLGANWVRSRNHLPSHPANTIQAF